MAKLPVTPVVLPAVLKGKQNGKIPSEILEPCGMGSFTLVGPAARACRALVAALAAEGIEAWSTGNYRSYDQQVNLFLSRYVTKQLPGQPTKVWNGTTYWKKPFVAMAAVPGTSNHGLGLAVDFAEKRAGKVVSVSKQFVTWMINNAHRFGFSAEAQSENWHWRYVAGDNIPQEVLNWEAGVSPVSPTPDTHDCTRNVVRRGDTGHCVRFAQERLLFHGFEPGPADGKFGRKTQDAVKYFQQTNGLKADGVVGPKETWPALMKGK